MTMTTTCRIDTTDYKMHAGLTNPSMTKSVHLACHRAVSFSAASPYMHPYTHAYVPNTIYTNVVLSFLDLV